MKVHTGTTVATSVHWIAPLPDNVAHAYPRARTGDAACGALRVAERWGYAVKSHCEPCLIVLGAEEARVAPLTESEQRAIWGDR